MTRTHAGAGGDMDIICPPLVERAHRVCRAWQKAACRQSFAEARAEGRRQHLGQSASSMAASTPHRPSQIQLITLILSGWIILRNLPSAPWPNQAALLIFLA